MLSERLDKSGILFLEPRTDKMSVINRINNRRDVLRPVKKLIRGLAGGLSVTCQMEDGRKGCLISSRPGRTNNMINS